MKNSRTVLLTILTLVLPAAALVAGQTQVANGQQLRFQRPSVSRQALREQQVNKKFRAPNAVASKTAQEHETNVAPRVARAQAVERQAKSIAIPAEVSLSLQELKRDSQIAPASVRRVQHVPDLAEDVELPESEQSSPSATKEQPVEEIEQPGASCGLYIDAGSCGCEVGCGMADACPGNCEPGCGIAEPSCGCATPGCGGCVGLPGPDYWCFPICLPRFKDLSFWSGVHGFRGPRDFYAPGSAVAGTQSDSNFGFQEGLGISGRAPLIGLFFPQLSYQLGYQTVQSRLSGTVNDAADRTQQFVTAGFFRRVNTGLQFGVVWDLMRDDLYIEDDLQQIRTEFSIKSPRGREIGFWTASSTNSIDVLGVEYEVVDQYALFYRCNMGKSSSGWVWVGLTGDDEGIVGTEFNTPLNDRWSLQTGFNYLITDESAGRKGVSQESWNIGFNLVWHLGRTARTCYQSPFRPLFSVADNGWMFVDRVGAN